MEHGRSDDRVDQASNSWNRVCELLLDEHEGILLVSYLYVRENQGPICQATNIQHDSHGVKQVVGALGIDVMLEVQAIGCFNGEVNGEGGATDGPLGQVLRLKAVGVQFQTAYQYIYSEEDVADNIVFIGVSLDQFVVL